MTLTPHSLLVPVSRKGRAIPLLLLWAIRPVQSLGACTEPGCLYRAWVPVQSLGACTRGALYSYTVTYVFWRNMWPASGW